jgi:hypothetical protein
MSPAGPECELEVAEDGSERFPDALGHDLERLYGPALPPEQVTADGVLRLLDVRLAVEPDGSARLCDAGSTAGGCPAGAPSVRSTFHPDRLEGWHGWVQGQVLARRGPVGSSTLRRSLRGWERAPRTSSMRIPARWASSRGTLVDVVPERWRLAGGAR